MGRIWPFALSIVLLGGCSADLLPFEEEAGRSQVYYSSSQLSDTLQLVELDEERGIGVIENLAPNAQTLRYRFTWYDAGGLELTSSSNQWQEVLIPELSLKTLNSRNKPEDGVYFRLQISNQKQE